MLQLGAAAARRKGYDPAKRPAYEGMTKTFRNDRTGEVRQVPRGVSPGWDTNPGKYRMDNLRRLWDGKLAPLGEDARRMAAADLTRSPLFETIMRGGSGYDPKLARTDNAQAQRGRFAVPVANVPASVAQVMGSDATLAKLSVADGAKQAVNHRDLSPADYARVQEALDRPTVIVPEPMRRQLHIFADLAARSIHVLLRKAASTGELFLKSFHIIDKGDAAGRAARKQRQVADGG